MFANAEICHGGKKSLRGREYDRAQEEVASGGNRRVETGGTFFQKNLSSYLEEGGGGLRKAGERDPGDRL